MRIPDLRAKLEKLEFLLGHQFQSAHFLDKAIAAAIQITPEAWARKKGGMPIRPAELTRLVLHYKLPRGVKPEVFLLPLDEFCAVLEQHKIGLFGPDDAQLARQMMVQNPRSRYGGLRLLRVRATRAGLGDASEAEPGPAAEVFFTGQKTVIEIAVPKPGYLLVINDQIPFGEATCLVPSVFAQYLSISKPVLRVPEANSRRRTLDVMGPPGWYRIFAIWTPTPLSDLWLDAEFANTQPQKISDTALKHLAGQLLEHNQNGQEMSIMIADYRVTE